MFSNPESSNPTNNPSMEEIIAESSHCNHPRRSFMKGSLGVATWAAFGGMGAGALVSGAANAAAPSPLLGFTSVPANTVPLVDAVTVPVGYKADVLVSWGDSLNLLPHWDPATAMTTAQQLHSWGAHNDGMHYFTFGREIDLGILKINTGNGNAQGLLVANNEYNDPGLVLSTTTYATDAMTQDKVDVQLAAHGVSIAAVRRSGKRDWNVVRTSPFNRRITGATPMNISGPAAGHALLKTPADPTGTRVLGTLNNCAHGHTPWGTYLACEENFNGYFGTAAANLTAVPRTALETRYGLSANGFGYRWHEADPRFDLRAGGQVSNEPNRFGWVVEIDPFDPKSTPIKRTALGRFKHEGAWSAVDDANNVAVYMGDDERFDYIYKFVCAKQFNPRNLRANRDLLETGTLYVARFNADGSGVWLPLVHGQNGLTAANGFADQGEVLIKARMAGDVLGATRMDRPEWAAVHPKTREVYVTLTNNSARTAAQVDAANPRAANVYGHIIRWRETGNTVVATSFEWDLFVQAGDSLDPNPARQGNINGDDYGSPDGLWFDAAGRLWIQTDQAGDGAGIHANIGGNVMMCADVTTGETRRFLTSPKHCEVTGVVTTPDMKTMFVGIQHPGEDWTTSFTQNSTWPDSGVNGATTASKNGPAKPRSSVVVITKDDGGVIGS